MDQVANVVEQGGNDFVWRAVLLLGQLRSLECVLQLCYGFAAIEFATLVGKEPGQAIDDVGYLSL